MLRERISKELKEAIKGKNARGTSTLRLVSAAIKDRDIAAREKGNQDGITDDEILALLQSMIKQRGDSIKLYEQGGRMELAEQEREEIEIIKRFLPAQLSDEQIIEAIDRIISELGADCIKDMGKAMGALKSKYTGQMDFSKASKLVRDRLCP